MSNSPTHLPATDRAGGSTDSPIRRGAKALVTSSSRALLVRERHADGRPFWTLPGGGVRSCESLVAGLRRELSEELRCDLVVDRAVTEFWYAHLSAPYSVSRYTVFSCSVVSGVRPVRREGVLASRWIDPECPPTGTLPQVRRLLAEHVL